MTSDHLDGRTDSVDRMIDESLGRRFGPPDAAGFVPTALFAAGAPRSAGLVGSAPVRRMRPAWVRFAAVAACVAMLAVSGWSLWAYFGPKPAAESCQVPITRLDAFVALREGGFAPERSFSDAKALIKAVGDHVGVPLSIASIPAGVELRGMSTDPGVSPWCAAVIARVDGTDVVLFVDRRAVLVGGHQAKHELDHEATAQGVFEHTEALGSVSLHEVSPLPGARLIPLVREAQDGG